MMAKIVKGSSFKGCVNYIIDSKKGTTLLDADGLRLKSKDSVIQSFVAQAKLNPNLRKSVGHISLNFSEQDKDKPTDGVMVKIAREYMQKMGIKDTQYIVARHFDKAHPHIHLCYNRVDNKGKTISDKNDRYRSEKICKELTTKYGLYLSSGKENVKTHRLKEPDKTKYEIYHDLKDLIPKCKDWRQLTSALNKQGIEVKFKNKGKTDEVQGISFSKNGYTFNGSKIDRMFSYSKIDKLLDNNRVEQKQEQTQSTQQQKYIIESTLDALTGISGFEQHGENYGDIAFGNRMEYEEKQRQLKKKRGIRRYNKLNT